MINFACKKFILEDVIKCALGLTKADIKVLQLFMNESVDWLTTEYVAETLKLNLSTVQRGVKKLHERGVLMRSQENLDGGGYLYSYQIKSRKEVRNLLMDIVDSWCKKVDAELENWQKS